MEYNDYGNNSGQRRDDEPLYSEKIISDRKIFFVDLKENDRGAFIKITEDVRGRRDTIMVPIEVAADLRDAIDRALEEEEQHE